MVVRNGGGSVCVVGNWSCVSHWCGDFDSQRFSVDNSVEAMNGVGSVLYSAAEAVRVGEGVRTLDDITVAVLLLGFAVTSQVIINTVTEGVLWMWVVRFGDHGFGYWGGVGQWSVRKHWGGWEHASVDNSQQGGAYDELESHFELMNS